MGGIWLRLQSIIACGSVWLVHEIFFCVTLFFEPPFNGSERMPSSSSFSDELRHD
jgi:hypothetical protein